MKVIGAVLSATASGTELMVVIAAVVVTATTSSALVVATVLPIGVSWMLKEGGMCYEK